MLSSGSTDTYQWINSVSQPIFTGFNLLSTFRLADLGVDVAQAQVRLTMLDLVLSVKEAYFDFLRAQNATSVTRARLNSLLGIPVDNPLEVQDILNFHKVNIDYDQARRTVRLERPELEQNDYYDPTQGQILDQIDWTFWEWGRTHYQVSQRRAAKRRLENTRRDLQYQVDLQVKQYYLALVDSQKNIATSETSIRSATENFRIIKERFREQLTTTTPRCWTPRPC